MAKNTSGSSSSNSSDKNKSTATASTKTASTPSSSSNSAKSANNSASARTAVSTPSSTKSIAASSGSSTSAKNTTTAASLSNSNSGGNNAVKTSSSPRTSTPAPRSISGSNEGKSNAKFNSLNGTSATDMTVLESLSRANAAVDPTLAAALAARVGGTPDIATESVRRALGAQDSGLQAVLNSQIARKQAQTSLSDPLIARSMELVNGVQPEGGLAAAVQAAARADPRFAAASADVFPAPSWDRPVDPRIVQTMLGEAGNQGPLGQAAVAQSVMNRSQKDPEHIIDPVDVVLADRQFSTWNDPKHGGNNPEQFEPGTAAFKAAENLYRDVRDNAYDFTGGATHYYNPDVANPNWADPNVPGTEKLYDTITIGDHDFLPRVAPGDRPGMNANPALSATIAAGGIGPDPIRVADAVPVGGLADALSYTGPFAPSPSMGSSVAIPAGGRYTVSDMVRAAQSPDTERLYSPEVPASVARIPAADTLTLADLGGGPRPRPQTVSERTMGGGDGPIAGGPLLNEPAAKVEPTIWDNVVDMTGSMLGNTLLGGAVKTFFPDAWESMGNGFKNPSGSLADTGGGYDRWGDPVNPMNSLMQGNTNNNSSSNGLWAYDGFLDANNNGTDDRQETPQTPAYVAPSLAPRNVSFPDMPPYRPGIDNEWRYFTGPGYADGGMVEAVPEAAPSPFAGMDPRVTIIADAEDALDGTAADPEAAIKKFVDTFGEEALKTLAAQVKQGLSLRKGKPRVVQGPGGPTDDAVPAMIDGVQPAALSSGEVVMPVDAVMGAGDGDPRAGADKLMALADHLSGKNA